MRRSAPLAAVLFLLLAGPAHAATKTWSKTVKLPPIAGYEVKQAMVGAPHPKVDGHIVAMSVNIVDRDGTPVPIRRLMLHHIVFANYNRPDTTCIGRKLTYWDSRKIDVPMPERFYGAGEERAQLFLPGGYGYPMNKNDAWGMTYMVMNHRKTTDQAYVKYTITYDTGAYTPVKPYWLDEENCKVDPIYNVRGGARKGTLDRRTVDVRMRESGRLVAGGGHVHGGAKRLELSRPDCSAKPIARSLPTWGAKNHPFYKVRPVLHEPGPINMTGFLSAGGIPVAKGERLRLSSIYDARDPHVRVMGIFVVYVAPGAANAPKCAPVPRDVWNSPRPKGRYTAPRWPIPLTGLNADGRAVTIKAPPGKLKRLRSGATVKLRSFRFGTRNVLLKKGAKLRWKFLDTGQSGLHNVTLANGPEAIGTDNLNDGRTAAFRFRRKGTYRLFCALHPVLMSERVVVR